MDQFNLWSLRLGFSNKESKKIEKMGFPSFLEASFATQVDDTIPDFLSESPKGLAQLRERRMQIQTGDQPTKKEMLTKEIQISQEMKIWWLKKMQSESFPLREKMTCFWHNHFVATFQKVRVNHWIFEHNQLLRKEAFGNFRELTKKVIQTNAMVRYLDNTENRRDRINENLSRELLELFTLGIGHYTEADVKNGAKGLAGLHIGENQAVYRPFLQNNDTITFFGKKGSFKAEELVEIIFEQAEAPYLLTKKILQWFVYDLPDDELVRYYGDYFRKVDFEIQPLLHKIFTEEFEKNTAGSKIKDPLVYVLQLQHALHAYELPARLIIAFLMQQGMDLFNQPNVKGWKGGQEWLSSQLYLQRHRVANLLCNRAMISEQLGFFENNQQMKQSASHLSVYLEYDTQANAKKIISELCNRFLFQIDEGQLRDFEELLKYDFNPKDEGAPSAILRLFNAIATIPEFQLI